MCSIAEGDYGDEGAAHAMPVTKEEALDTSQLCKKCNAENVVVKLEAKDPQCRSCFLTYVHHKFRASLGSTKILPRDAEVVLVVDGSAKSIVLLDMCRFALQLDRFRRLRFSPKILFVDEQPLVDRETSQKVIQLIQEYNFEAFYVQIGGSCHPVPLTDQGTQRDKNFMEQFNSLNSLTSKQDFLVQQRKRIWRKAAKFLNCGIVFVPETNIDLARDLLTGISLGRGVAAAHDVAFVDDRVKEVKLVRPIRDLNEKEVEHYIRLNDLQWVQGVGLFGADQAASASIQNLTNGFVRGLQKDYSSTVATVFRTGDKLAPKPTEIEGQCRVCLCQLDTEGSETLFATELSSYLSTHEKDSEITDKLPGKSSTDLCHACYCLSRDTSGASAFILAFE